VLGHDFGVHPHFLGWAAATIRSGNLDHLDPTAVFQDADRATNLLDSRQLGPSLLLDLAVSERLGKRFLDLLRQPDGDVRVSIAPGLIDSSGVRLQELTPQAGGLGGIERHQRDAVDRAAAKDDLDEMENQRQRGEQAPILGKMADHHIRERVGPQAVFEVETPPVKEVLSLFVEIEVGDLSLFVDLAAKGDRVQLIERLEDLVSFILRFNVRIPVDLDEGA
jgi:hypothetical protein